MEDKKDIKYSSYTEAQKRATKKYRENNKEKVNEQRKKYYQNRKAKDPKFLEYKRIKAKEYYQKKKALKKPKTEEQILDEVKEEFKTSIPMEIFNATELGQLIEKAKEEPKELIITKIEEHPIIDETKTEKKKRKYNKKNKTI